MSDEKLYIGTKMILAQPCGYEDFMNDVRAEPILPGEDKPGYMVRYPDGYISWSPKAAFEDAYRELTKGERVLYDTCGK